MVEGRSRSTEPPRRGGLLALSCLLLLALVLLPTPARGHEEEERESGQEPTGATATSVLRKEGFGPRISLHGFADVSIHAARVHPDEGESFSESAFVLGELNLYIVSALAENISFLGEMVFEQESDGSSRFDVERLFIKYALSDMWSLALGRHHTAFGYWNETYHHGLLLQPTVHRPEMLRFEDQGGILPIHSVGLVAGGTKFSGSWAFDYVAGITNGRAAVFGEIQTTSDENNSKALNAKLSIVRDRASRIRFGASAYADEIPGRLDAPGRENALNELILGGHFHFRNDKLEVMSEYFNVRHEDRVSGERYDNFGYYAIAVWHQWRWKPYGGIDRLDLDPDDSYFVTLNPLLRRLLLGVRFDINPFNAVKIEYNRDEREGFDADVFLAQVAFTF